MIYTRALVYFIIKRACNTITTWRNACILEFPRVIIIIIIIKKAISYLARVAAKRKLEIKSFVLSTCLLRACVINIRTVDSFQIRVSVTVSATSMSLLILRHGHQFSNGVIPNEVNETRRKLIIESDEANVVNENKGDK